MANSPASTAQAPETVHRTLRCRLYPGNAAMGIRLTAIAGACRYVWNPMLTDAYARFLADPVHAGRPRFQARHFTVPAFTIPSDVKIRDGPPARAQGRLAAAGGQRPVHRMPAPNHADRGR